MEQTEKFGLLTYQEGKGTYNVGDYVQSLAARQFLPRVDLLMNREALGSYHDGPYKLIMNGWFTHNIHKWIPSEAIHPLFVSFHLNSSAAPFMLTEEGIAYLKKHQPIGCRDQFTADLLQKKGIDAYFTGCLTLTLDSYKVADSERTDEIYIVDPFYNYPSWSKESETAKSLVKSVMNGNLFKLHKAQSHLKNIAEESLLKAAKYETQVMPVGKQTDEEKFALADSLLRKYAKAKLVITSRIHCALPCLAMGTPVIFVNGFDTVVDTCRFDGILNLFNRVDVKPDGSFTTNFDLHGKITLDTMVTNKDLHVPIANALKEKCKAFVKAPVQVNQVV